MENSRLPKELGPISELSDNDLSILALIVQADMYSKVLSKMQDDLKNKLKHLSIIQDVLKNKIENLGGLENE